jgi:hypothetical protein
MLGAQIPYQITSENVAILELATLFYKHSNQYSWPEYHPPHSSYLPLFSLA